MDLDARTVTLQDVADRAGVSRGTASLALSGKGRMTEATRRRVTDAASDLEYVANASARYLRGSRSGAVGLYIPDHTLNARYYMDVAFGAVQAAQASDLLVTLMPTDFAGRPGIAEQLDGFIIIDPEDGDPVVERLLRGRRPVVSGEDAPADLPAPAGVVKGDHRAGIRTLLDHVWEQGSRHPVCVLPDESVAWGREMLAGYREWCAERNVTPRPILATFRSSAAEVRAVIDDMLARTPDVDAIIAAPEGAAVIALEAVRATGRETPRDVLIASCVDSDPLALMDPSITTLDLQPRVFGAACVALLWSVLEGTDQGPFAHEVPISLVARGSTHRI